MNENKTVRVRNLEVGMVLNVYGRTVTVHSLREDHRRDGYWMRFHPEGAETHRWYRQTMELA